MVLCGSSSREFNIRLFNIQMVSQPINMILKYYTHKYTKIFTDAGTTRNHFYCTSKDDKNCKLSKCNHTNYIKIMQIHIILIL